MKFYKYLFITLLFLPFSSYAGDAHFVNGARALGMGGNPLTLVDVWSVENNQAAMAFMDKPAGGIFYQNRFLLKELGIQGANFVYPIHHNAIGLNLSSYGYSAYNERKIGLSFGQQLNENISVGVQLNYMLTQLGENYGSTGNLAVAVGVMAKLNEKINLAAHVYNPTRTKLAEYNNERNPATLSLAASYKFSDRVLATAGVRKDIDYKAAIKFGIEYMPLNHFYLRAGISSNPFQTSFGFGYAYHQFQVDIAAFYHSVLGVIPGISICYAPIKKPK